MAKTLTYKEIVSRLKDRTSGASKQATAGSGAPGTPSVQVTEKDPQDEGTVQIPKDPSTAPKATNLPGSGTDSHPVHNKEVTAVKPVGATSPSQTVTDDNGAGSAAKAAKVVSAIRDLRATFKQAASDPKNTDVKAPAAEGKPVEPKKEAKKAEMEKEAPKAEKAAEINGAVDDGKHPVVNADKAAQGPKADQVKEKDPQEEPKPSVREDAIGGVPSNADTNESTKGNENKDKTAAHVEFDPSYHFKLASVVLANDELRKAAEAAMQESLGAEVARDLIKAASVMENEANALAELEANGALEAEELWKSASNEERALIVKLAAFHDYSRGKLKTDFEKSAYDMGATAAADEMDQPPMPGADAGAGAPPADPAAGAPAGPDAGGEVTPEDIMAVLQHLVQSGQIDEQTAQAILTELSGGGAPGGDAGAPPDAGAGAPPDAGAGAPPEAAPEAAPADDEAPADVKEMADKSASVIAKLKPAAK